MLRSLAVIVALSVSSVWMTAGASAGEFEDAVVAYQASDYAAAYPAFMDMASAGHSGAETMLGVMYFGGQGVERNESFAAIWFFKASRKGNPNAHLAFGSLHIRGVGVLQNLSKAYKWLLLAAERGEGAVASEANRLLTEIGTLMSDAQRQRAIAEAKAWRPIILTEETSE
ncbi:MAG: sel1 repeat family protein [Proteobacteria bacterium]|nr:sel1 repeat family protein [Pseudomonadota bacterium]